MSGYTNLPSGAGDDLPGVSDPDAGGLAVFYKSNSDSGGDKRGLYVAREGNDYVAIAPVGMVALWAGDTAPRGWFLCDGSAIDRTAYSDLFDIMGTTYGTGDGSTTFNLPNLKGTIPVGFDSGQTEFNALGKTGGEKTHALSTGELASHTHAQNAPSSASGGAIKLANDTNASGNTASGLSTASAGSGTAHNNLQPYITLNYIVKA